MNSVALRIALASALVGSCGILSLSSANANTLNYNLSVCATCSPTTNVAGGTSETFVPTSGPAAATITATGYSYTGSLSSGSFTGTATKLYNKSQGGDEVGLGINSDPTGNGEIYTGTLIRIDVTTARAQGVGPFSFSMGSTTQGEAWSVYGSNTANTGLVNLYLNNTGDGVTDPLTLYNYYYFAYTGPALTYGKYWSNGHWVTYETSTCGGCNVLLDTFSGQYTTELTTPLPGALPLFVSGLGAFGFVGWRRKRKAIAARAA
jgi:hypothetical protein